MLFNYSFTRNQKPQSAASATMPIHGYRQGLGSCVVLGNECNCDWTIGRNFEMDSTISFLKTLKRPAF